MKLVYNEDTILSPRLGQHNVVDEVHALYKHNNRYMLCELARRICRSTTGFAHTNTLSMFNQCYEPYDLKSKFSNPSLGVDCRMP